MPHPSARVNVAGFAKLLGKSSTFVRQLIAAGEVAYEDVRSPGSTVPRYEFDPREAQRWRESRRQRRCRADRSKPADSRLTGRRINVIDVIR